MISGFFRGIKRTLLFCSSMICFYGAYLGLCTRSTDNHVNAIRGGDTVIWIIAAFLVTMFGSYLLYLLRRMDGTPEKKSIIQVGIPVFIALFVYGLFVAHDMIVINMGDFVTAPVVQGYDREGYVAEYPQLDTGKVNAYLDSINDPKDRARIEYLFDTSGFSFDIYEDFENFETRCDGSIHNGDVIKVRFEYDKTFAEKHHISFDNVFMSYDVDGLGERPAPDWNVDLLTRVALNYERSIGSDANMAETGEEYENGDIELITSHVDGERKELCGYYRVDPDSMMGSDEMTGTPINFNKFY